VAGRNFESSFHHQQYAVISSAPDDDLLIEPAEEGLLAPSAPRGRRQPMRNVVTP
jgi:hypothetical protein